MFLKKLFRKKKSAESNSHKIIDSGNLKVVIQTDLGNIRLNNEDLGMFFRIADEQVFRERGHLLIVADGMGGHQAGEVASKMATESISREYFKKGGSDNIEKPSVRLLKPPMPIFLKKPPQKNHSMAWAPPAPQWLLLIKPCTMRM